MQSNQITVVAKGSAIQKIYYKVISGDMILQVDLDLEDSKPIVLEDNLAHDDASPYVSLVVKGSAIQRLSSGQTINIH